MPSFCKIELVYFFFLAIPLFLHKSNNMDLVYQYHLYRINIQSLGGTFEIIPAKYSLAVLALYSVSDFSLICVFSFIPPFR